MHDGMIRALLQDEVAQDLEVRGLYLVLQDVALPVPGC